MAERYTIAIAGATGDLGTLVTRTLLQHPYDQIFSHVRILTRDVSSPKAQALKKEGERGIITQFDPSDEASVDQALNGVDVFINILGNIDDKTKDNLIRSLVKNKVKVYIPSEYGVDHAKINFEAPMLKSKLHHQEIARELGRGELKVVAVYVGLFLEDSIVGAQYAPLLGFDQEHVTYTSVGPPTVRANYVGIQDIARSVARVAQLAIDPKTSSTVPDHVRISGAVASYADIAAVVEKVAGTKIKLESIELAEWKEKMIASPGLIAYMRYIPGAGLMNYENDNHNELVNPGESLWKWKSVEDQIKNLHEQGRL
ncbi:NAD(P)-binding protein [Sistotremastrum suecicum HHB10207 ss-3]|uniref:NAD(P)-binding protein n=1 Tax=Sistotremastrum suecicum HHB10207 ss-3 TaxID=1314776 RepID=A0A166DMT6_9AGAM|nr:NAD(P)-binding protein [Sistotremastrum suecicum HHB10207 ss-3]